MKIIHSVVSVFLLYLVFISVYSSAGCANIIPPSGGPKDTLAPKLVSAVPQNGTLRFKDKLITLTFDEYVEIKEKEQNLIINPVPKSSPTVEYKLKVVTVRLKDSLQPNTTYSINFGKSIRDVNEGNIIKNFTYVFSTGRYIDSLDFSGKVTMAVSGKADSTLSVILHRHLYDSAVTKERPRYTTKVDTSGNFTFHNLAPGTYAVYALKDESGSGMYTSKSQIFAFADSPVLIGQNNPPISLYAYAEEAEKKSTAKKTGGSGTAPAPKQPAKDKNKRLIVQSNITGGSFDILDTLRFQFTTPLKTFDSTQFFFTDDQFADIKAQQYHLSLDSTRKTLTLLYKWQPDTKFYILANKEFAEDTLERKLLKNDTIAFRTKKESDYGEVHLRFRNLDLGRHPVLQFFQGDVIKYAHKFVNKEFQSKLFRPGEYDLRILYDDNGNGIWDPGDFTLHRQPEKVQAVKQNNGKRKYVVRANWDNDIDYTL